MKILLFTSQDISRRVTEYFLTRKGDALRVVTQVTPRDKIYGYQTVEDLCRTRGVPCVAPVKWDEEFLNDIRRFGPDVIVNAYFPRIFPKAIIDLPPLGVINVHPGNLPHYRGTFPTAWMILNGEKEITITLHYVDENIDSGDILAKEAFPISPDETGHALYVRAMHLAADVLIKHFDDFARGRISRRQQIGYGSYYNTLPAHYHIDWHQSREMVQRHVRAHAKPYFPAYTFLFNRCVLINKISFCEVDGTFAQSAGCIVKVYSDRRFAVSCVDGCVMVEDYEIFPVLSEAEMRLHLLENTRLI